MSFHPELLVNHLAKEFLPEVRIVKLTLEKEIGRNKREKETEIRYVEIIDKYEKLEEVDGNNFQSVVNLFYHYLFTKSQVSVKGLKLFQYLINNGKIMGTARTNMITIDKKKVYFTKITVEEHNKIEWVKNTDILNYMRVNVSIENNTHRTSVETYDKDFQRWYILSYEKNIPYEDRDWYREFYFN